MKYKFFASVSAAILAVSMTAIASGDTSGTSQASVETVNVPLTVNPILAAAKAGQPKHIKYELEAYAYAFGFIPLSGKAEFDLSLKGGDIYGLTTKVRTTGLADLFVNYDLQVGASGYVLDNDLLTYNYVSQNNDGKKNRRVELTYGESDVEMVATPGYRDLGFPPATPEQKLEARDPITAFMASGLRPHSVENPCGEPIKFFDGKQLTHMSFTYIKDTEVKARAYKGIAHECHVQLDRVAGYNKGDKGRNLSGIDGPMRMYFAELAPGFVGPVKLLVDTDTAAGRITVEAKRFFIEDVEE